MKLTLRASTVLLVVAAMVCGATPAVSQTTDLPPVRGGLFGGDDVARRARHKLDFSLSLVEANDSDTPAEVRGIAPVDTLIGGYSTMLMGTTDYHWEGSRVQVGATSSSVLRRYSELQDLRTVSYSGGVGLSARLGARTTLLANQTVAYSPSYLYGLFPGYGVRKPGDAVPTAADYAVDDSESFAYGTTVGLTHGLTRRSRVSATGDFQYTDYVHKTGNLQDLNSKGIRGDLSHNLSRNASLRVGYRYRTGAFGYGFGGIGSGLQTTEHGVEAGVDYSRPISATRRMIFGFSVGSSTADTPVATAGEVSEGRLIRLSGAGSIGWQFARGWQTRASFRRGVEYIAQLSQPVYADGFSTDIEGFLTSRLDITASARYSTGASALYRSALTFDTYGADVRVRYALTRSLAVYGQYLYYFYDFQQATTLPTGIPPGLERNGVRAGLTVWVPALRR
jgi:hypothetical protein